MELLPAAADGCSGAAGEAASVWRMARRMAAVGGEGVSSFHHVIHRIPAFDGAR